MTQRNLQDITLWHDLFDELCHRAGFYEPAALASRYCEMSDGSGQRQYDAALRNLQNWRSGRHLPRIRSLRILERLLEVERDAAVHARWNELYALAADPNAPASAAQPESEGPAERPRWTASLPGMRAVAAGTLLFVLGVAIGNVWGIGWRPWAAPADSAPIVVYEPEVTMTVGESKVIHAERGDCGKLPRNWNEVESNLPATALGTFSDGGLARRNSKFCKGHTPARAILFTAHRAGMEELKIEGDFMKVTVIEPQGTQEERLAEDGI